MLVVALQSGGWQCTQLGELWRCEASVKSSPQTSVTAPQPPSADTGAPASSRQALAATPGSRAVELGDSGSSANTSDGASPGVREESAVTTTSVASEESVHDPAVEQGALPEGESKYEAALEQAAPPSRTRTTENQAVTAPRAPSPENPAGEPPHAATPIASAGYVVQVGAYRRKELAETAAGRIDYDGVVIAPTVRAGENWFVLLLGAFPTLKDARAAGEAYQRSHPGGSFWVRTAEDLQRVLTN